MSAPAGAPQSPAPRSGSIGPASVGMHIPPPQHPINAPIPAPMPPNPPAGGAPPQTMSQQNLNQIVIDYLAKKGYTRTEATLRAESAQHDISGPMPNSNGPTGPPKHVEAFEALKNWVDDALDIYKPELRRLLWPIFAHSFLSLISSLWMREGRKLFDLYKNLFMQDHAQDVRALERISLPEHLQDNATAKLYRENKYRLTVSEPAFFHLMQFLEGLADNKGRLLIPILESQCNIKLADRASDDRYSFAALLARGKETQDLPAEDEGIPGHHPGSAYTGDKPGLDGVLTKVRLGKLPMETELEGDVRAELEEIDEKQPPGVGEDSLVKTHEMINIKQEEDDEGPSRGDIPYPPSTARDVAMEVQKIRENRDRFRIEKNARTGGIGPSMSVCMFTFHNTFDSVTCIDFSGDNNLAAVGTSESYIRVWSIDGKAISTVDSSMPPSNSHRLIGHSGPVYAVAFAPATESSSDIEGISETRTHWLLSSSADSTIRLWNLDAWQQIVVYKGHHGPVWDLCWSPFGHYFVTGGHDKTARLWATDKVRHLRLLAGHDDGVDVVAYHPNTAYVFTASSDRTVRMYAVTNGQAVRMFTGHPNPITALACSKDGKQLASGDDAGNIFLWDLASGRLFKRLKGHGKGGIWSLSYSVESTVLVSGGADGTVRVWDVHPAAKPYTNQPSGNASVAQIAGSGTTDSTKDGAASGGGGAQSSTVATTSTAVGTMTSSIGGTGKRRKDDVVSWEQISAFATKKSPVYKVKVTGRNLVIAGGAYLP